MSRFSNLRSTKKHKFISLEIELAKLSVADVIAIQEQAKGAEDQEDEAANIRLMLTVIRKGVAEMAEMSDEELLALPMDELSALSAEIMKFSGLGKAQ